MTKATILPSDGSYPSVVSTSIVGSRSNESGAKEL